MHILLDEYLIISIAFMDVMQYGSKTGSSFVAGYGKMPEYEHIFTDFLLGLVKDKYKRRSG